MKRLTFVLALMFIISMMSYSAFMFGTLAHELTHASHAVNLKAIEVNYDASGAAYADIFVGDTEEYAYFNGALMMSTMLLLGLFSLIIVMGYKYG
jgi:hypothetical protein